jgi:hypothetical protein
LGEAIWARGGRGRTDNMKEEAVQRERKRER